jgi:hypothetical protein
MPALLAFLIRGCDPVLFAVVAFLERYGTQMGTWTWASTWPVTGLPGGNPPSGVPAGDCLFDALALRLGPRLAAGWPSAPGAREPVHPGAAPCSPILRGPLHLPGETDGVVD